MNMDADKLVINKVILSDLPRIIEFVVRWLQDKGLGMYRFAFETAVDEASTNVMKYAYDGNSGYFEISCSLRNDEVIIKIKDHGKSFDPNSAPLPDVKADLDSRMIGGLGIYMMKKMMDEVSHSYDAGAGNVLTLRKRVHNIKDKASQ